MSQNLKLSRIITCDKHQKPLTSICIAPQCFNFREMCPDCIMDDIHHAKMHYDRNSAFLKVQDDIDILFKGLKALRKKIIQTLDTNVNSQHGLNEIQDKLQQIKKILNNKIDNFHSELRKIYEKNVKQKLNELFYIVEKSYQFLQQEKLKLFKTQKLKPFFVNDLNHQLKYFQSSYQQILQKNIRRFKAGLQHDKVLKLMVSFQQNLSQIFKFQTISVTQNVNSHLLYANEKGHHLYKMKGSTLNKLQVNIVNKKDFWVGILQSIYFSPKDCYYLIGEGLRQSNKIRRLSLQNGQIKDIQVKLQTKRMNFAVCLFNQQIFIVGGQNSKQGCLSKCQKFIPSQGKSYIVSSLNHRSSQHTLCSYKNKFILKFGGTDILSSILDVHHQRYQALLPEIYSPETEDWKVLSFLSASGGYISTKINFGLWPGVFAPNEQEKIIILSGKNVQKKGLKSRYDITFEYSNKQVRQIKQLVIQTFKNSMSSQNRIISDCCGYGQDGKIYFLALDEEKGGIFYNASIAHQPNKQLNQQ